MTMRILGKVHNAEAARGNLLYNAISADVQTIRQGSVLLASHFPLLRSIDSRGGIVWTYWLFVKF
jgi:hypothetical protein